MIEYLTDKIKKVKLEFFLITGLESLDAGIIGCDIDTLYEFRSSTTITLTYLRDGNFSKQSFKLEIIPLWYDINGYFFIEQHTNSPITNKLFELLEEFRLEFS